MRLASSEVSFKLILPVVAPATELSGVGSHKIQAPPCFCQKKSFLSTGNATFAIRKRQ